ncbi:MAG TPA: hypothetical protein VLT33_50260 [Labilithrix sp.]|nr:hypothetical protein [Labilithrix sp.]
MSGTSSARRSADTSLAHTWHPTLEQAKAAAARDYGVAEEDWKVEGKGPGDHE